MFLPSCTDVRHPSASLFTAAPPSDLDLLYSLDEPTPAQPAAAQTSTQSHNPGDLLDDLMGGGSSSLPPAPAPQSTAITSTDDWGSLMGPAATSSAAPTTLTPQQANTSSDPFGDLMGGGSPSLPLQEDGDFAPFVAAPTASVGDPFASFPQQGNGASGLLGGVSQPQQPGVSVNDMLQNVPPPSKDPFADLLS